MKAIVTKYHGPTNTKSARISASDVDGNRVYISVRVGDSDPHASAAKALMKKMGWKGRLLGGSIKGGKAWVFELSSYALTVE